MDNPGIKNLGDRAITAALTNEVVTLVPDSYGVNQAYVADLAGMGSVSLEARFIYGSGGSNCIVRVYTSLDQGQTAIEIARFDFAQANRLASAVVSGAAPADPATVAALSEEGTQNILGDRLWAEVTSTGIYAGNTSVSVRAVVRGAGASTNVARRGTLTSRAGALASGTTSQQMMAANASRKYLLIQNPTTAAGQDIGTAEALYIRFGASDAGIDDGTSIELAAGGSIVMEGEFVSTEAVQVNATTTEHRWIAVEG